MQKIWSLVLALLFTGMGAATVQAEIVPPSQIKVVRFFAFQGVPEAMTLLGQIYETGDGLDQDLAEAVELYTDAAEQNYADAQFHLGSLYERGLGVEQNTATALGWYEKSCQYGSKEGCAAAQRLK